MIISRLFLVAAVLAASSPAALAAGDDVEPPVQFTACGVGLECAVLHAPLDHGEPVGRTIALPVIRHRASDPAERRGVLVIGPGGPGAAGDYVRFLVGALAPGLPAVLSPELLARYDVIGLDPRGTSGPDAVRCLTGAQREAGYPANGDPALPGGLPRPEIYAAAAEFVAACAQRNDPAVLTQLATDDGARDLDLLRVRLGEGRVSFYGVSYGTLLGATYATMFPDRLGRLVLDSPVHPAFQRRPLRALLEQAAGAERVLDAYFRACAAAGPGCPFGDGLPGAAFDALVERLERQPLRTANGGIVDGYTALYAARVAVIQRTRWPALTRALIDAEAGDPTAMATLVDRFVRGPDGAISDRGETATAVNCIDQDAPGDLARYDSHAAALTRVAPRTGVLVAYTLLPCASWPVRTDRFYAGPYTGSGAPPALVLGTRLDSQTPHAWARAMARTLQGARLLTIEGVGHGVYGSSGPCADAAVTRYLLDGHLPAPGATCEQRPSADPSLPLPPAAAGLDAPVLSP